MNYLHKLNLIMEKLHYILKMEYIKLDQIIKDGLVLMH